MGVIIPPESTLGKELARWDAPKREGGERPNGHEEYPKMLYMAHRYSNGKVMCGHPRAAMGDDPEANAFTAKCQFTVQSGDDHARMRRAGWCDSPEDALDAFEAQEQDVAKAAAEEQFRVRRMSGKAQDEFDKAQDATDFHDPDPEAPKLPPTTVDEAALREKLEAELRAKITEELRAEAAGSEPKKKPAKAKKTAGAPAN